MIKALKEKSDIDVLFVIASICPMKLVCKHEVTITMLNQITVA